MLKHLLPIVSATLLLLIIFASAIPLFHWFQIDKLPQGEVQYEEKYEQWRTSGIESYELVLRKDCLCEFPANIPIRIVVRDSLNVAVYDGRQPFDPLADRIENVPFSVAALFELVEEAAQRSELVSVTYDEEYAFPNKFELDPDPAVAGDTVTWSVTAFSRTDADP